VTRLVCPFCGPRALREFIFHKTLPAESSTNAYERTYTRLADPTLSSEHWQHVEGCRGWLLVRRNPSSGEVLEVRLLGGAGA
jgi:heterotetrameric sarcosine oxidase delta subunit